MEKKQTAVEWLVEQIEKDENVRLRGLNIRNLLEQAKKMEKEQNQLELPSDEEIYELAEKILAVDYLSFTEGAKWMRDKIKGGNNE
jgi:hypothetical protein